jgi:hypothetical protein
MALTKASYSMINGAPLNVKDFGAVGNGTTDDTAALTAAAAALQSNQTLYFPNGTYLISYQGTPYSSVYGNVVMDFDNLSDLTFVGEGATIKVNNHNITTYGGLRFANFKSCKRVRIEGFTFDMTFTGTNTSGSFYPFCGAITGIDDYADGQTQSELNGDFLIQDCEFNLYHPWGQYVTTSAPYSGDSNNGYKLYSVFLSGPYLGSTYEAQCRNVIIQNCTIKKGHNGYGFWLWAWNNVNVLNNTAEDWVAKRSSVSGSVLGAGTAFIRYMQFLCSGILIQGNNFRAKPCSERTTAGFEGSAIFAAVDTNQTGDYSFGKSVIANNTVVLGNGDSANSLSDYGAEIFVYGQVIIESNAFDGSSESTNAYQGTCVYYGAEAVGGDGTGSLVVNGNTFGKFCSYLNNISISNGSNIGEYQRRCKSLIVTNNISMSQLQYFLDMSSNSTATNLGVRQVVINSNTIDGTYNTVFNSANTNSRAINYVSTNANDEAVICNNLILNKYYGFFASSGAPSNTPTIYNNTMIGVTANSILYDGFSAAKNGVAVSNGTTTVLVITGANTPEGAVTAPVGSLFLRNDGSTSTTLYVKTSGAGNTGWTAK